MDLGYVLGVTCQGLLLSQRERGNSGNSQTLDASKSIDGSFPKMRNIRRAVGLDGELKSSV